MCLLLGAVSHDTRDYVDKACNVAVFLQDALNQELYACCKPCSNPWQLVLSAMLCNILLAWMLLVAQIIAEEY